MCRGVVVLNNIQNSEYGFWMMRKRKSPARDPCLIQTRDSRFGPNLTKPPISVLMIYHTYRTQYSSRTDMYKINPFFYRGVGGWRKGGAISHCSCKFFTRRHFVPLRGNRWNLGSKIHTKALIVTRETGVSLDETPVLVDAGTDSFFFLELSLVPLTCRQKPLFHPMYLSTLLIFFSSAPGCEKLGRGRDGLLVPSSIVCVKTVLEL